jgi:succinylglutamic semialdehyde dehydrogenase
MTTSTEKNIPDQHYLNGKWQQSTGELFSSTNPFNNALIWQGNTATPKEIAIASDAAHKALSNWATLDSTSRSNYLQKFADIVEKNRQTLTELISLETGKPLWESATEVTAVIGKVKLSLQAYQERTSEKQTVTPEATACLRFKPHGVVAVLGAFNFPAHLSNGHIVPALLAGNTVIYKPSELTPAVAAFIMQCWHDSGIPAGVINCVQGTARTGELLLSSDIQGVYFTGSYKTGKRINQHFSDRPDIILALEMGGNNPLVVDDIEDIDAAVYQTILSTLMTAGQRCTCARRVLIRDNSQGDLFLNKLIKAYKKIQVGAFTEQPEPFMGPVISHQHATAHLHAQQQLIEAGGNPLLAMTLLRENSGLLSPGIIDMTNANSNTDEEIFAPFIQIYRYRQFDEALTMANKTRYGLCAGLLSDSAAQYKQFYQTIRAGLINWNRPTTGAAGSLPFGGVGLSGNHRPSAYFAADYCAYPIASMEQPILNKPSQLLPGIDLD